MAEVLLELINRICLVYLVDQIIFLKKRSEHASDFLAVFYKICFAGLKLQPSKCSLFADQVLLFGHVNSAAGVSFDLTKLRLLAD